MMMILACRPAAAAGLKISALEQKIYEIEVLRTKIIDKIDQAIDMRSRLEQQLAEFRGEIRAEQIRAEIYSHRQALQNLRIRYNLSLVQTLRAYINLLNERIDYFYTGKERLKFLVDQIHDDLAIINTLKDMQIEILLDRIIRGLDELIPEVQKQIFDAAHVRLLPIESVWQEISLKTDHSQPH